MLVSAARHYPLFQLSLTLCSPKWHFGKEAGCTKIPFEESPLTQWRVIAAIVRAFSAFHWRECLFMQVLDPCRRRKGTNVPPFWLLHFQETHKRRSHSRGCGCGWEGETAKEISIFSRFCLLLCLETRAKANLQLIPFVSGIERGKDFKHSEKATIVHWAIVKLLAV